VHGLRVPQEEVTVIPDVSAQPFQQCALRVPVEIDDDVPAKNDVERPFPDHILLIHEIEPLKCDECPELLSDPHLLLVTVLASQKVFLFE
jgi:hypothetical protein